MRRYVTQQPSVIGVLGSGLASQHAAIVGARVGKRVKLPAPRRLRLCLRRLAPGDTGLVLW
ncbi:hypothetical protein [Actinomyces sp. MRS3W]|uniref:hypothetical protein n=1 Tax=Actinomyces sp. MRS3W TaxID=2800796 RepID=UPI0028FD72F0|nr:hypothetical protein [Actinomyces sp. MRS3W]MDU0348420.1 hypothetical protein [Actinomyces sp. MRS3W]